LKTTIKKSGENLRNWFKLFDDNKDNYMDFSEFKEMLKKIGIGVREGDL